MVKPPVVPHLLYSLDDEGRRSLGTLLAALYLEGTMRTYVGRENIEDDLWTQVSITRHDDFERGGFHYIWSVKGMEPYRQEPGKIITTEKVYLKLPWMLQPWFLVPTFTILGMTLGFLVGVAR